VWLTELIWTFWRTQISLAPVRIKLRFLGCPASSLVAIPTELRQLPIDRGKRQTAGFGSLWTLQWTAGLHTRKSRDFISLPIINFQGVHVQSRRRDASSVIEVQYQQKQRFFSFSQCPNKFWGPCSFLGVTGLLSPELKREESEAYYLPSFCGWLRTYGVVPPLSHISSWNSVYLRPGKILPYFTLSYSVLSSYELIRRVSVLSCPWARQLYRRETLQSLGHTVTADVFTDTIKGKSVQWMW
jgi:hypothetical protein